MLSVKKLQDVMESILEDGIEGISLMTIEGCLLCSAFKFEETQGPTLAAISSSIYQSFLQGNREINFHLIKLENGAIAFTPTGKDKYLLAAYGGQSLALGLLKGRLLALSSYFDNIFDQS